MSAQVVVIDAIVPMKGYDSVELALVSGWQAVVGKGQFKVGDHVIYFSINSMMTPIPELQSLKTHEEKTIVDGIEKTTTYTRPLKTKKFRDYVSQGLITPLGWFGIPADTPVGTMLDIVAKYIPREEKSVYATGVTRGTWPKFIPKTDEERIQNAVRQLEKIKYRKIVVLQKFDGTSTSFVFFNSRWFICGRNYELLEPKGNETYFEAAKITDVQRKMTELGRNIAIQCETIGRKINGNRHGVDKISSYVFNIYDINESRYLDWDEVEKICEELDLVTVPVVFTGTFIDYIKQIANKMGIEDNEYVRGNDIVGDMVECWRFAYEDENKYQPDAKSGSDSAHVPVPAPASDQVSASASDQVPASASDQVPASASAAAAYELSKERTRAWCKILLRAADYQKYPTGMPCEGLGLKSADGIRFSYKIISNDYLVKYNL